MPSKRVNPEDPDRLGIPRHEYVVTIPRVGAISRGSVPDTDPMYRRGWSVVSGSSTERPSIGDLIPPDWTIVPAKPGRTITIIGAPHPGRPKPKPSE